MPRSPSTVSTLRPAAASGRRQGFSLIELLVVLAILAAIMLLTLRVSSSWKDTSRRQSCTTAMAHLRSAAKDYQQAIPTPLADTDAAGYYIANPGTGGTAVRALTPMEYFLFRVSGVPVCQAQLDRVPATMLVTEQAATVEIWKAGTPATLMQAGYVLKTVKDPWNNELKYRSSSLAATEPDPAIPSSPDYSHFFSSAGPDGLWGTLSGHDINQPDDDASDNIYFTQ